MLTFTSAGSVLSSEFVKHKGHAMRAREYAPTFTTEGLRKDFDLELAAAHALEVPMPIAATTHQQLETAIEHGHGQSDSTWYEVARVVHPKWTQKEMDKNVNAYKECTCRR
jgi:3-hydroxyisobutyrate dehydrogenase-like beta-hydroxyacid dehydrogenase